MGNGASEVATSRWWPSYGAKVMAIGQEGA
jgi:hypothetical protein